MKKFQTWLIALALIAVGSAGAIGIGYQKANDNGINGNVNIITSQAIGVSEITFGDWPEADDSALAVIAEDGLSYIIGLQLNNGDLYGNPLDDQEIKICLYNYAKTVMKVKLTVVLTDPHVKSITRPDPADYPCDDIHIWYTGDEEDTIGQFDPWTYFVELPPATDAGPGIECFYMWVDVGNKVQPGFYTFETFIEPTNYGDLTTTNMDSTPPPPSGRDSHAMAYDSTNDKVVLFGGYDGSNKFDDTWTYDTSTDIWTKQNPTTKPSARRFHAMAYDSNEKKVVLFGGVGKYSYSDETWTYDTSTDIWTKQNPTTKPSAREAHAIAYDSTNNKVVLFGGYDSSGYNDETWTYDGINWEKQNPTTKPSARLRHAMAYDSTNNKVVLFGESGPSGRNDETWTYDGSDWTNENPTTKPSARYGHAMAYDSTNKEVVLFGGLDSSLNWNDETWTYDGSDWTKENPTTKPSARNSHAMAYDFTNKEVVLFGGYDGSYKDDTWTYDVATDTWTEKTTTTNPSAREYHAMAYDSTNDKVVLFGGGDASVINDDTWIYDTAWNIRTEK